MHHRRRALTSTLSAESLSIGNRAFYRSNRIAHRKVPTNLKLNSLTHFQISALPLSPLSTNLKQSKKMDRVKAKKTSGKKKPSVLATLSRNQRTQKKLNAKRKSQKVSEQSPTVENKEGTKEVKKGQKAHKKKPNTDSLNTFIKRVSPLIIACGMSDTMSPLFQVMRQVNPTMKLDRESVEVLNEIARDLIDKLITESISMSEKVNRKTVQERDAMTAVRLVLPGELAKVCPILLHCSHKISALQHAINEAIKAVRTYNENKGKKME